MKSVLTVLFITISFVLSGCSVTVDKGAGVIHTSSFLGDMTHGYPVHSGLDIQSPTPDIRMVANYSICQRLNRSSEVWRASGAKDPYPVVEIYRDVEKGGVGEDVFIPATKLTNYRNILNVTVDFFQGDTWVGRDENIFYASFYQGVWQARWHPQPRS